MTYSLIAADQTVTVFASKSEADKAARALGGKRIRRASATPKQLSYYELPSGKQVCVRQDVVSS